MAEARGIGVYSAEKPQCSALAVNLPPRNDYWRDVEYPPRSPDDDPSVSYYTLGKPSPFPPPTLAAGFYPVKVVDKQTTKLSSKLSPRWPRRGPSPMLIQTGQICGKVVLAVD